MVFDEVESNENYRAAFGDLRKKFDEIVERFEARPVTVKITNMSTGNSEPVKMDRRAFLASVRFQMYSLGGNRELPKLLCDLHDGDFRPWILSTLKTSVALRQQLTRTFAGCGATATPPAAADLPAAGRRVDRQNVAGGTVGELPGALLDADRGAGATFAVSARPAGVGRTHAAVTAGPLRLRCQSTTTRPRWGRP